MAVITSEALWQLLAVCVPLINGQPLVAPKTLFQVIQTGEWHDGVMHSDAVSPPNRNGSRDHGLAQINEVNFPWLGLTAATAQDPCRSIAAGARVFASTAAYNAGNFSSKAGIDYALRTIGARSSQKSQPITVAYDLLPQSLTDVPGPATGEIDFSGVK